MYHVFLTTGAWTTLRYHSLFSCVCIQLTSGHHTSHVTQCAGPRHTKIEGHAMASRREAKRFALRTEGEGLRDTPQSDVSRCPTSPSMRRRRSAAHLNRTSDRIRSQLETGSASNQLFHSSERSLMPSSRSFSVLSQWATAMSFVFTCDSACDSFFRFC